MIDVDDIKEAAGNTSSEEVVVLVAL